MAFPKCSFDDVAWLTADQMVEVDRIMMEDLRIGLIQMMENAGRHLADLVVELHDPSSVTVLAGSGGNGGGGLVAARHLANRGVDVSVTLGVEEDRLTTVPAHQFDIIRRMGVPIDASPRRSAVTIDALIGYSLKGAPRGRIGELIEEQRERPEPIVALDTPSGLDVTDGSIPGAVINASATMTLALPKHGLRDAAAVGQLFVADISVPPSVSVSVGAGPSPDFSRGGIVELEQV